MCRTWLEICAPRLYRLIHLHTRHVNEFIRNLSKLGSRSRIAQHAKRLWIHGPVPWLALPKLLPLLRHLDELTVYPPHKAPHQYHTSHPRMASSMFTAASRAALTLNTLSLMNVEFSSATDVLRLLDFFPRLSRISLSGCTIPPGIAFARSVPSTCLRRFDISRANKVKHKLLPDIIVEAAFFAQWWRWPHLSSDPEVGAYPGLHEEDISCILALWKVLGRLECGA